MFNLFGKENFCVRLARASAILTKYYNTSVDCTKTLIISKYVEIPNVLADDINTFEDFLLYFKAVQATIYQNLKLNIALDADIEKLTLKTK